MWNLLLLLWSCICISVVVGDPETVIGHRGGRVDIRCSYESGFESHSKYFCKGECSFGNKNIIIKSGSPAKDERFSLTDDTTARFFTVTITDLRTEDEGQYWCVVKRSLPLPDVYLEILLKVKQAPPPSPITSSTGKGLIGIIIAVVLVLLLIGAVLLIVAVRKKKLTCGFVSSSIEGLHLTLRKEENEYDKGNSTVLPNSHTAQSDKSSAVNAFHRPANTEPADTDLDYINVAAALTNGLNPDQIYTELNASRQSNIYQCLRADSAPEESIYDYIDKTND